MFSRLEPFFKTSFRQAEYADTRLDIREEDKRQRRNQNDENTDQHQDTDLWTDETRVSIEALRAFLIAFLRNEVETEQQQSAPVQTHINNVKNVTQNKSYKAANAYQTTAQRNATIDVQPQPTEHDNTQISGVKIEEIRVMNALITDLNALASERVEYLVIPKEESFLQSLQKAVENAKAS